MRRRVVVTGLGCLTPVGNDVTTTWNNLLEGVSGVDCITHFDASTFPSKIAGGLLLARLKRRRDPIPLAPFLTAGLIITVLYGEEILRLYLGR